jgi:hypothetical protein
MSGAKLQASGLLRLEQDGELHVLERLGRLTGLIVRQPLEDHECW